MTLDTTLLERVESPTLLLQLLRKATPDARRLLGEQLEQAIANRGAESSSGVGTGTPIRLRARLLAHREVLAFDQTGSVEGLSSNVPEAVIELNEVYTHIVRFDVGRHLLQRYRARWPTARPLAFLPPLVGQVDKPVDAFRDDVNLDVQIVRASYAAATFVVFCGLRHAFGAQLNVLHHCCLAKHGTNVIYLRDFAQSLYLTGIESVGNLRDTCEHLRRVFFDLNTRKLVFIGGSSGVFGALYYGALLNASAVLLFSGPSSLDIGVEETERQAYRRLLELRQAGKIEWPNLREIYSGRATPVSFYYGVKNRVDRAQAENLLGLSNVHLHPVDTASHLVLDYLALSGAFDRIFAAAAS